MWPFKRRKAKAPANTPAPAKAKPVPVIDPTPDEPIGFGRKTAWAAVKSEDHARVAEVLGIEDIAVANWSSGEQFAYETPSRGFVFITPPIQGWTLIHGHGLFFEESKEQAELAVRASETFGAACVFENYRVSGVYCWTRAEDGKLVRQRRELDSSVESSGEPTEIERQWALLPDDDLLDDDVDFEAFDWVDEEDVLEVARAWSVDPIGIDLKEDLPGTGWVGRNPRWADS